MKHNLKSLFILIFISALSFFIFSSCDFNPKKTKVIVYEYNVVFQDYPEFNKTVKSNQVIEKPIPPLKEGFKFVGWFSEGKKFDFNTKINSDVNMKAKFVDIKLLKEEIEKVEKLINSPKFEEKYNEKSKNILKNALKKVIDNIKNLNNEEQICNEINILKQYSKDLVVASGENEKANKKELEKYYGLAVKLNNTVYVKQEEVDNVLNNLKNSLNNLTLVNEKNYENEIQNFSIILADRQENENLTIMFDLLDTANYKDIKDLNNFKNEYLDFLLLNNKKLNINDFEINSNHGVLKINIPKASIGDILTIKKGIIYKSMLVDKIITLAKSKNELNLVYNGAKFILDNGNFIKAKDIKISKDNIIIKSNDIEEIDYKYYPLNTHGQLEFKYDKNIILNVKEDKTNNKIIIHSLNNEDKDLDFILKVKIKNTDIEKNINIKILKAIFEKSNLPANLLYYFGKNNKNKLTNSYSNYTDYLFKDYVSNKLIKVEYKNVSKQEDNIVLLGNNKKNKTTNYPYENYIVLNIDKKEKIEKVVLNIGLFNKKDYAYLKNIKVLFIENDKIVEKVIENKDISNKKELKDYEFILNNEEIKNYDKILITITKSKEVTTNKPRIIINEIKVFKK